MVIDDHAIANWSVAIKQFLRFAGPVVLIIERFNSIPVLQRVTLVMKPFLGEPLIGASAKRSPTPRDVTYIPLRT